MSTQLGDPVELSGRDVVASGNRVVDGDGVKTTTSSYACGVIGGSCGGTTDCGQSDALGVSG